MYTQLQLLLNAHWLCRGRRAGLDKKFVKALEPSLAHRLQDRQLMTGGSVLCDICRVSDVRMSAYNYVAHEIDVCLVLDHLSPLELHHFSSNSHHFQDAREAWGSVRQRARLARLPVVHEPEPEVIAAGWEVGEECLEQTTSCHCCSVIPSFGTLLSV